jgi:hypothetical protein
MRFNLPILRRISDALRRRDWFGIGFELFVVIVGVLLGLEASRWSAEREEREYSGQMLAALDETLKVYQGACGEIHTHIQGKLNAFDSATAAGKRPPPPHIHFRDLERPPTRAWDAMVATGIARTIQPELVFRLARYFSYGEGWGDRYQRYNAFTENEILPYLGSPARFYDSAGKLSPLYAAHVERLRELLELNDHMGREAGEMRRALKQKRVFRS